MKKYAFWVIVSSMILSSGCAIIHSYEEVRRNEQRIGIKFESEKAAKLFNEAFSSIERRLGAKNLPDSTRVDLILITLYRKQRKLSDNAFYNDAVNEADTDGNLIVTEDEALRFYKSKIPEYFRNHGIEGVDVMSDIRVIEPKKGESKFERLKIINRTSIDISDKILEETQAKLKSRLYKQNAFIEGENLTLAYKFVNFEDDSGVFIRGKVISVVDVVYLDSSDNMLAHINIDVTILQATPESLEYVADTISKKLSDYTISHFKRKA